MLPWVCFITVHSIQFSIHHKLKQKEIANTPNPIESHILVKQQKNVTK